MKGGKRTISYGVDARNETFEAVTVFGKPMIFTCLRVNRDTIPKGMHLYEVRHADENWGEPVQVCSGVLVNHYGTLLSNKPIHRMIRSEFSHNSYRDITNDEDWNFEGCGITLQEYLEKHPIEKEQERER